MNLVRFNLITVHIISEFFIILLILTLSHPYCCYYRSRYCADQYTRFVELLSDIISPLVLDISNLRFLKDMHIPRNIPVDVRESLIGFDRWGYPADEYAHNIVMFYILLEEGKFADWPADSKAIVGRREGENERKAYGPFKASEINDRLQELKLIYAISWSINRQFERADEEIEIDEAHGVRGREFQVRYS